MIILASNSWLRKTIMDKSGLDYATCPADIDERALEDEYAHASHDELVKILASTKANHVSKDYPNDLVVAADTFAVLPTGDRLHKPKNPEEAIDLCMRQSGKTIQVFTGLAMKYKGISLVDVSRTDVSYTDFTEDEIKKLLTEDDATIRNAGLGFFLDAPGFTLTSSFNGSYTGAMGLPMEILRANLKTLEYES